MWRDSFEGLENNSGDYYNKINEYDPTNFWESDDDTYDLCDEFQATAEDRTSFHPSKYQKEIYDFIQKGKGNAVVEAVAGSGKTSSLVKAIEFIPTDNKILFIAFNKSIVDVLKKKLEHVSYVSISTIHGLGYKSCLQAYNCKFDKQKYKTWLNNGIKSHKIGPTALFDVRFPRGWYDNVLKLIDLGRVCLIKDETGLEDLAKKHGISIFDNEIKIAFDGITWGINNPNIIDYNDMIFLPVVKKLSVNQYDWVFIDECQDLNAAQRNMILKFIKPNGRFIAAGDPHQAIYGFSGADVGSFEHLKKLPNTKTLPLSICYRCDKKIIEIVKKTVPQIEARGNAKEGVINRNASKNEVQDGDLILCRVSAPLVKLWMEYLSRGVKAYVKGGGSIGKELIDMIEKTKKIKIVEVTDILKKELARIEESIVKKGNCSEKEARGSDTYMYYEDKIKIIEILTDKLVLTKDVVSKINNLFNNKNTNGICLSTVHKSKGLESDRVFIICPEKFLLEQCMSIPWMAEQERNLEYVAYTRAKHYLGLITDFKYDE